MAENRYQLAHFPQIPCKPFEMEHHDLSVLVEVRAALANYDLFLLENNHRADYANATSISEWNEEYEEWWDLEDHEITDILNGGEFN